jgi:hypothetical protein
MSIAADSLVASMCLVGTDVVARSSIGVEKQARIAQAKVFLAITNVIWDLRRALSLRLIATF